MVLSANGRVKPDVVLIDGREEHHPEGAYDIECTRAPGGAGYRWAKTRLMPTLDG